ncbi:hypothetical protein HMPREF1864_01582 [Peptoniphilus sp. DNF00840]|nr:hypothetical protein HMPREF1864_01582 [Peptoniphilus sp. DNF00840]
MLARSFIKIFMESYLSKNNMLTMSDKSLFKDLKCLLVILKNYLVFLFNHLLKFIFLFLIFI